MKLLQRVMLLIRANVNEMVEKSADPEQLLRQLQQDLRNQMVQVKTQVATAIAQEHTIQSRCDDLTKQAANWQHKAELAVLHGDDAQARRALQQRMDVLRLLESYRRQHEEQQHLIVTLRNALKQLQAKTEEAELTLELYQMNRRRAQLQQAVYEGLARQRQEETVEEQLHRMKRRQPPAQPAQPTQRQLSPPGAAQPAELSPPLGAPAQPAAAERPQEMPALPAPEHLSAPSSLLSEQVEELLQPRRTRQPRRRTTPSTTHPDHPARKRASGD